jgi:hypothetical protein
MALFSVAHQDWSIAVAKWHIARRPYCFDTVAMPFDLHWRSQMDEPRTFSSTLRERKLGTIEAFSVTGMHQIVTVTRSNAKAAELPERIGSHFFRVFGLGLGTAQMNNDDSVLLHVSYFSR